MSEREPKSKPCDDLKGTCDEYPSCACGRAWKQLEQRNRRIVVLAKCIGCGAKREIGSGEVPDDDMPMCHVCSMPMIAERAKAKP